MRLKRTVEPASEPVAVSELKTHLRLDSDAEDTYLGTLISSAREMIEDYIQRSLITTTWRLSLDQFPSESGDDWWDGVREGAITEIIRAARHIELPMGPVIAVSSFNTFDDSGEEFEFDSSNYVVDSESVPGRVSLKHGHTWPTTILRSNNGIQITYTAGYGAAASSVPARLKAACLQFAAHLYEHRGDSETLIRMPDTINVLLKPFVTMRL